MADLSMNRSRRKRLGGAEGGSSFKEGGTSIIPMVAAVILILALVALFVAPNEVDSALNRTATVVSDKAAPTQVWNSVVSTFSSEEPREEPQVTSMSPLANAAMIKPNESVATSAGQSRTMLTRGHDILELEPATTIVDGNRGLDDSMSIIQLIEGTIHIKAAKRTDGGTLSIETQYLVATVKGTKFDVTVTDQGAAVSVREGVVFVRAIGSNEGVDVTHDRTAVVLAGTTMPRLSTTTGGGALAALEAASTGVISNSNHHKR